MKTIACLLLVMISACQARPSRQPAASKSTPPVASMTPAPSSPAPSTAAPASASHSCGNSKLEEGESCDDGNTRGGDGCSPGCRRELVGFLSWDYVLLADGTIFDRTTGRALAGRAVLTAPEGAVLETEQGLQYFHGLLPLPSEARIVLVGAGAPPCLLDELEQVWCSGGSLTSFGRPPFLTGPEVKQGSQIARWNQLRRAEGAVSGLAGNIDVGCILLDGGAAAQCWGREPMGPGFSLSAKMPLGRGRVARQIVAGSEHVCVLTQNGEVGCWGDSSYGQTGYMAEVVAIDRHDLPGPERRRRTPPSNFLKFPSPAKQLAASAGESCALLEDGKVWCWGDTDALAFEDPREPTFQERMESDRIHHPSGAHFPKPLGAGTLPRSPIKLPDACKVKSFNLVAGQLCVRCDDGCSKCWGESRATLNVKRAEPPAECLTD